MRKLDEIREATSLAPGPPPLTGSLAEVSADAAQCRRCSLYKNATRTVFGEGPQDARIMLVGEQPGDREDVTGRPFVGPAGRVLDKALGEVGIDRADIYVTNAVKHFKFEERGKQRLHKHPNRYEVQQCRWWLDKEFGAVDPELVVALGALAAGALMGRAMVLNRERGRLLRWRDGRAGLATIHPSAVLRMRDEKERSAAFLGFVGDLRIALALASRRASG